MLPQEKGDILFPPTPFRTSENGAISEGGDELLSAPSETSESRIGLVCANFLSGNDRAWTNNIRKRAEYCFESIVPEERTH